MKDLTELYRGTEKHLQQLGQDLYAAQKAYENIIFFINAALDSRHYSALPQLLPYMEKGEGELALRYIDKAHRFLCVLNIITLELDYQKDLFCADCGSAEALWEKYTLTVFAFRRLLLRLSEESVSQAVSYLQNNPISLFAAYMIIQDARMIPAKNLYETLATVYAEHWDAEDLRYFFSLASRDMK